MARPRDSQRSAVYRWEATIRRELVPYDYRKELLSLPSCRALVKKIAEDYDIKAPEVKDGRGTTTAYAYGGWAVGFPRWARRPVTIIHEMAHIILYRRIRESLSAHGREFASLVLDMYKRYLGIDHVKARKMAIVQKPRRVRFAKMVDIPKPIKKVYKLKPVVIAASKEK